ncbi:MAG: hypothetical protein NXI09_11730 [Bacteroidetes bacterium]|nr:hypothetical protein [Bacteroidota bacterium]
MKISKEMQKALIEMDAPPGFEANKDDPRFYLSFEDREALEENTDYKIYKTNLLTGYTAALFKLLKDKVEIVCFSPRLAVVLRSPDLKIKNLETKQLEQFPSEKYWKTYKSAFINGQDYFNENFRPVDKLIYGDNSKELVQRLDRFAFSEHVKNYSSQGWSFVTKQEPFLITHRTIYTHGFYSGAFQSVLMFAKDHREVFQKWGSALTGHARKDDKKNNPFPRIFKDGYAWEMFTELADPLMELKKNLVDWSFIYRAMQMDDADLIYKDIGNSEFKRWLEDEKFVTLESDFKTYNNSRNEQRVSNYRKTRESYQEESKWINDSKVY